MNTCPNCYNETDETLFPFKLRHKDSVGKDTEPVCSACRTTMRDQETADLAKMIVDKLAHECNGGDVAALGYRLGESLLLEHRYLQSEIVMALWFMFRKYSLLTFGNPEGKTEQEVKGHGTDVRNNAAAEMVQKWSKVLDRGQK